MDFRFTVNAEEVAQHLQQALESVAIRLREELEKLSISAHAFIINKAQTELTGYNRQAFLGQDNRNIRWVKVGDSIWVVEIDEKARYIEEGRSAVFMEWLLTKNPKAKRAKDGCVLNPRNKVLTNTGWKKIKDVNKGDYVLTHSGKFREVRDILIQTAGIGTRYVKFTINSQNTHHNPRRKKLDSNELIRPSISLTEDHLVLTPKGWVQAGLLQNGDLVATPADLARTCLQCQQPLPINANNARFCLNNRCARIYSYRSGKQLGKITPDERTRWGKLGHECARQLGYFERDDGGARNPDVLHRMRLASAAAMRKLRSSNRWHPETFLEQKLRAYNIPHIREHPIKTNRVVNAGGGRLRHSTMFFDFYVPQLGIAIELDGVHWHQHPDVIERDRAKDRAANKQNIKVIRIPSHEIYKKAEELCKGLQLHIRNHSGQLGVAWVPICRLVKGVVNRKDHVYSKKYDLCLDADEHSFCCQTVFIHNSTYAHIPFTHARGAKTNVGSPVLGAMVKAALKREGISLRKVERNPDGTPKLGVLHRLRITPPGTQSQFPSLFSMPRTSAMSAITGLPAHEGIFYLQDAVVTQRQDDRGKVRREVTTFRTISSKHKAEGRWFYPSIEAFNSLGAAHKWALEQWDGIVAQLQAEFGRRQ